MMRLHPITGHLLCFTDVCWGHLSSYDVPIGLHRHVPSVAGIPIHSVTIEPIVFRALQLTPFFHIIFTRFFMNEAQFQQYAT